MSSDGGGEQVGIIEGDVVGRELGKAGVHREILQLSLHIVTQSGASPIDHSFFRLELQLGRIITTRHIQDFQTVLVGVTRQDNVVKVEVGFLVKAHLGGHGVGLPPHIVFGVQHIASEKILVEFHLLLVLRHSVRGVILRDFEPRLRLIGKVTQGKCFVSVDIGFKVRKGTEFMLQHLVSLLDEGHLSIIHQILLPHGRKVVQKVFSLLLTILRYGGEHLLHLLNRFGRIVGKTGKTLCITTDSCTQHQDDQYDSFHSQIFENWTATQRSRTLWDTYCN